MAKVAMFGKRKDGVEMRHERFHGSRKLCDFLLQHYRCLIAEHCELLETSILGMLDQTAEELFQIIAGELVPKENQPRCIGHDGQSAESRRNHKQRAIHAAAHGMHAMAA